MIYPNNKKFAFTIVDDTDGATIENVKPVYDYLYKLGLKTTKTIWVLPTRDGFNGLSIEDYRYRQYIKKLQRQGFEIALHSVGSGRFTRQDVIDGLYVYRKFIGQYPKIQINHAQNPDSIYWGIKRFDLFKFFWRWSKFCGDEQKSPYFWGDYHKKYIKYTRNFCFSNLNTIKIDPNTPYKDPAKTQANHWFSSSDGSDVDKFIKLTRSKNVDLLEKEGGAAIIYTHFASGFVKNGRLNSEFKKNLAYIAQKGGYFVSASELLEHLFTQNKNRTISSSRLIKLELKWLWGELVDKLFSFR